MSRQFYGDLRQHRVKEQHQGPQGIIITTFMIALWQYSIQQQQTLTMGTNTSDESLQSKMDYYNNVSKANFEVFGTNFNMTETDFNVTESTSNVTDSGNGTVWLKTLSDLALPTTLCVIMLGMGCTIRIKSLIEHLRPPIGPAIGMVSQFFVLPASMFGLAHLLQLDRYSAIGMIVLASSPGGSTSNLFSHWTDGDVSLSLTMTTLSTILALGLMPLNIWLYSRSWVSDDLSVPYINILLSLLMIVIPASIGIFTRWKWPKIADFLVKAGSISGVIVIITTLTLVSLRYPYMYSASWRIYTGAILQPFVGFAFGYILAKILRMEDSLARTVSLETGIQNFPLCMTVITLSFPEHVISKLALLPLLAGVTIILDSCLFLIIYKVIKYIKLGRKAKYIAANQDDEKKAGEALTIY